MQDDEDSIMSLPVESSPAYRYGVAGVDQDTQNREDVYGYDVVELYNKLPEEDQETMTLNRMHVLWCRGKDKWDDLKQDIEQSLEEGGIERRLKVYVVELAESLQRERAKDALSRIMQLSTDSALLPDEVDGYIAVALSNKTYKKYTPAIRDPWGYLDGNNPSYGTLRSNALYSKGTILELKGHNVHFMMFKDGDTKLDCIRFSFGGKGSGDEYDPSSIGTDFLSALGLNQEGLAERLSIHAKRLEMVQWILRNHETAQETLTQLLFQHVLGCLVKQLEDGDSDSAVIVDDVTGMDEVDVLVCVCNEYLQLQGKTHDNRQSGKKVHLKIKSDLVVGNPQADDKKGVAKQKFFLYGLYNIEMKAAQGVLKGTAIKPKSQLIAESLARSIQIKSDGEEHPNVLFSALSDSFSLYILVHFREEQTAYLSHREIDPGRIIAILAWLHTMSKRGDLTLEIFKNKQIVVVGGKFEDEVQASLPDKRSQDSGGKKDPAKGNRGTPNHGRSVKRKASPSEYEIVLDPHAMDELEEEMERQQKRETFSALLNHYHFGKELPLTENVIETLHGKDTGTFYAANIARAGLS